MFMFSVFSTLIKCVFTFWVYFLPFTKCTLLWSILEGVYKLQDQGTQVDHSLVNVHVSVSGFGQSVVSSSYMGGMQRSQNRNRSVNLSYVMARFCFMVTELQRGPRSWCNSVFFLCIPVDHNVLTLYFLNIIWSSTEGNLDRDKIGAEPLR